LPVEPAEIDLTVAETDAAAQAAAANDRVLEVDIGFVNPEDFPALHVDGKDVVVARDDIDHAFVEQRLRLLRVALAEARAVQAHTPNGLHLADVASVDLIECGVALVVQVAAIRHPVLGRPLHELGGVEGRHLLDRLGGFRQARGGGENGAEDEDASAQVGLLHR